MACAIAVLVVVALSVVGTVVALVVWLSRVFVGFLEAQKAALPASPDQFWPVRDVLVTVNLSCKCGAAFNRTLPHRAVLLMHQAWVRNHIGPAHGPAPARTEVAN
jgi:hypothetical protein